VGFVVEKLSVGLVFIWLLAFALIISPSLHIRIYIPSTLSGLNIRTMVNQSQKMETKICWIQILWI
jgi:hypothetical protein